MVSSSHGGLLPDTEARCSVFDLADKTASDEGVGVEVGGIPSGITTEGVSSGTGTHVDPSQSHFPSGLNMGLSMILEIHH
jgi:hypothetical protein